MPDTLPYDEKSLLLEVAAGDENAFRTLFDRYKARFYSVALKMTGSDEVAKDVVQDVFLNIWSNRNSLGNVDNPSSYFFTCVYRRVYQHYRKMALEKKLLHAVLPEKESANTTDEMILVRESKNLIAEAIEKLPARQRLVFKLSKQEGLSREDVARKLDISPNTVKNHLTDAVKFIRVFLRDSAFTLFIILSLFKK